jgi:hypothetical protein
MNALTQMASAGIPRVTKAGAGKRKLDSWIDRFVEHTDNTDSPRLFRKWAGIFAVASAMEMRTWLQTSSPLYPNLYVFIVGHPGVGKNRIVRVMKRFLNEIPEFHFAPTSLTGAALVDTLAASKRFIPRLPDPPLEYYNTTITAEELTAFMHKYDDEMVGLLSAFYDPDPYAQSRRGKDIKIKIDRPQVNLISGTTPSNLVALMPETAWDQGFTSRVILIYSDERIVGDDFAGTASSKLRPIIAMPLIIGVRWGNLRSSTILSFSIIKHDVEYICTSYRWSRPLIEVTFCFLQKKISIELWAGFWKQNPLCPIYSQLVERALTPEPSTKSSTSS